MERDPRTRPPYLGLEEIAIPTTCEYLADVDVQGNSLIRGSGRPINFIPSNDFSFYDQVLDALVLVGATHERFGQGPVTLERYFAMARNCREQTAMEMTK
jgi:hypothetical protein